MNPTTAHPTAHPTNVEVRAISADERTTFFQTMSVPYGFDPTPERFERFQRVFELPRLRAAFDGQQMVATFGSLSLKMTVPGGVLPVAGTSVVSVAPTHRRRGILRAMIVEHLADTHARGEPLAALWASESSIYGRFGYGPASERTVMKLEKPFAKLAQPVSNRGSMQLVETDEAVRTFPAIYDQVVRRRPGMFERSESWWRDRVFGDPEFARRGATAHRRVLHVRNGEPAGYAIFRTRTDTVKPTELLVVELLGADSDAERALWQFLFGVDLIDSIAYWNQPVDDPLQWWVEQPRRMERRLEDALWVRPVDVAAALCGRQYSCKGRVVFRMRDEQCPWNEGVFRLEADNDGKACCERVGDDPEVDLTSCALGSAYLGGHRFRDLARAGMITGRDSALRRLDAMFEWDPRPWCQEVF